MNGSITDQKDERSEIYNQLLNLAMKIIIGGFFIAIIILATIFALYDLPISTMVRFLPGASNPGNFGWFVDLYGEWPSYAVLGLCVLLLAMVFLIKAWGKFRTPLGFVVVSAVVATIIVEVLKYTVDRPRPEDPLGFFALFAIGPATGDSSFPSGHVLMAFALFAFVHIIPPHQLRLKIILGVGLAVWGISVAVARYLGAHYPSDTLFGAFIPLVTQLIFWMGVFKRKVNL